MQRREQCNTTDYPELPRVRKLQRSTESLVKKEELEFEVDLGIEGIAQWKIWRSQKNPSSSAKSRVAQLRNLAILHCTSCDRYPEPSSAFLA